MRGSVLSQRSRYIRRLPTAAVMFGLLAVLPSCASKAGQEQGSGPAPAATPKAAPKETASAQPKPAPAKPAPAKPAEAAKPATPATPAPATTPAPPPPPPPIDSAAVATQFCKRIMEGVKGAIKKDSTPADPREVARKIAATVPAATVSVAMAKDTRCR